MPYRCQITSIHGCRGQPNVGFDPPLSVRYPTTLVVVHHGTMQRRLMMFLAWLAATTLAVLVATMAVASVSNSVTEPPSPLGAPTTAVAEVTTSTAGLPTAVPQSTTTTGAPRPQTSTLPDGGDTPSTTTSSTTTTTPRATTTTSAPAPTTTLAPTTTTTTTAPPTTTTSTTDPGEVSSHAMVGGTTTIRVDADGVRLVAAVPNAGFQVEIKETGPDEVKVEYKSNDHISKFEVSWEDGELEFDLEEEPRDDDDQAD